MDASTAAAMAPDTEVLPATIHCRFVECRYAIHGMRESIKANYRGHLRDDHHIRCPKIEPEEIK